MTAEPSSLALFIPDEATRLVYEARLCVCPDTVTLCQTVLTDLYNEILADNSSPLKLVKSRAFISALLPHLTFVNGANVPSIRYGIRKYVLGEGYVFWFMNDCIIVYLFVSLSIFYFLMMSRQENLALLRDFKVRKGKKYGILKMGIFGSVARDQQTESSDVDIYYECEAQGLCSLSHLKIELEELLGSPVDIIRLRDRMNQLLRKRIEREGIYV